LAVVTMTMRNFVLGAVGIGFAGLILALAIFQFGVLPTNADARPSSLEYKIAERALDASMRRHAPHLSNPVPLTPENLMEGANLYTMNCSQCHGTLDFRASLLEHATYPPPPQLLLNPLKAPEWHTFYTIRTGVRYTAMPAWENALSDEQIWKITAFLTRIENLPPPVEEFWNKLYGVSPQSYKREHATGSQEKGRDQSQP
jgi:mono/diheme cytochrome c family protein